MTRNKKLTLVQEIVVARTIEEDRADKRRGQLLEFVGYEVLHDRVSSVKEENLATKLQSIHQRQDLNVNGFVAHPSHKGGSLRYWVWLIEVEERKVVVGLVLELDGCNLSQKENQRIAKLFILIPKLSHLVETNDVRGGSSCGQ